MTRPINRLRRDFRLPLGMSVTFLVIALDQPTTRIHEIVKVRRVINADTAERLAHYSARFSVIALAIVGAISLVACHQKEEVKPVPVVTVKLGHVAPMSGPQADLGKDSENGISLAIKELNAKGLEIGGAKVKFELLSEDDQADAKQALVVAQKLVNAKVNGVIGHFNSSTTIAASKIYADAGIPQISGSATNPEFTNQGFKTAFRVIATDVQQGKVLGEFAARHFKRVAVIDDHTAYGKVLANEFKKAAQGAGIKLVANEFITAKASASHFKAILTKIKSKKPDLIFFAGKEGEAAYLLYKIRKLGIKSGVLGGDSGCFTDYIPKNAHGESGYYCSRPGKPLEKLPATFREKLTNTIGYAPYVYDATMVMVDAMKRANSVEPAKYLPEVGRTKYEGVTALIEFDKKGDLKDGAISLYNYTFGPYFEYLLTLGSASAAQAEAPKPAARALIREGR